MDPTGLDELARLAASSPHSRSAPYNIIYNANPTLNVPDNTFYQSRDRHSNHHISGASPYPGRASPQSNSSYYPQPQVDPFEINMAHFELFHHFTSSTAPAITAGSSTEKLWSTTIPHIALSHRFLMHSILAVAALHIAYTNPSQRATYYAHASAHEDRALSLAQADIAHPSAENADALFAFVLTTVYYAFAAPETSAAPGSPMTEEDRPKPLYGAVQCINLLRGIRSIMPSVKDWVEAGPLAPLLDMQPSSVSSPRRFPDQSTEEHWSKLLLFASTTSTAGPKELEDIEIYSAAASLLRASSLRVDNLSEDELNAPPMWNWAVRLPQEFVERLAQLDVVPLVLVAHWCVLLPQIRHYWWIQGWVDRTMREIGTVLPEEYRPWLDWPLERIKFIREREAEFERLAGEEGGGERD